MSEALNKTSIALVATLQSFYLVRVQPKLAEDRGDTNFISILIILGIVVVVAGTFITFKDSIVKAVQGKINTFSDTFAGDTPIGG